MAFLGVYKALYDYAPLSEGELEISEGDLLYVLEKSEDDDWWKAKKKATAEDEEEPVGLIPNNYIEEVSLTCVVLCHGVCRRAAPDCRNHRHIPSTKPAPSTNIRDRPMRNCPSPRMSSSTSTTPPTPIGSWSGSMVTMVSFLPTT